ncbi:hypothetical protein [Zavarzinia sp. CC-PAN008]|uniref:hypothetical protein n=1 Tax=Zavarzinia sp. CC-PAN008 TaxID=3243332 RepID=UPI003F744176
MPPSEVEGYWRYRCFGLVIQADLELPEIAEAAEHSDAAADVTVSLAPAAPCASVRFAPAGRGAAFALEGLGHFLITRGAIVVTPVPGVSWRNLRLHLLGSALGALCYLRGLLPLHANAIVAAGQAIAFAGPSGAGKSTLAAHFQRSGYPILCDDVCVISFDADGRPWAWPGLPRIKLWADAALSLGHDPATLEPVHDSLAKYQLPLQVAVKGGPHPLRRIYILDRAETGAAPGQHRLSGREAFSTLFAQCYRNQFVAPLGLQQALFRQVTGALRHMDMYRAQRAWGFDVLEHEARRIGDHFADAS